MMSSASGGVPPPAVFLSYAREDAAAARRLAEALRAGGVEVWFDENERRGGDEWDKAIRKQIRDCTLYLPIISDGTQQRHEGFFRLEWHLAEQRSLLMAKGRPFIAPVCIDDTPERGAEVPEVFLAVQWMRVRDGENTDAFVARVKKLLAGGESLPANPPMGSSRSARKSRATAEDGAPDIPDYEMLRVIGRGSYGDVWLARGITGIFRAIKVVWRDRFADAGPYEREFKGLKEFAAISLGEPIQMALLHIGRSDDAGYFYYVMELADDADRGRDIVPASYVPLTLTEARKRRGRLPAAECVGIGVELARVLAGLHKRGLLHRDIKPSNIILVGGVAKLADIGLVTPASDASTFVGTEGFVPPEGPGSPSADVFALGKVIYELATGLDRQEFPKLPAEVRRLPDSKELFELNEIIIRACERDAAKRYADGVAFLADLLALQAGSSLRARRVRKGVLHGAAMTAMAAILVGSGFAWWKGRSHFHATPDSSPPRQVAAPASDKSIAVLRFSNLSGDTAQEYFSDGISEELISLLGRVPGLVVKGRSSSFYFTGKQATAQEKGQKLGVTYLVDGSVRRMGSTVRITAQLTRAATDEVVWSSEPLTRDVTDVFVVQDEIAGLIAQALSLKLGASFAAATAPVNPQAFEFYLQARQALNLRTHEGFARADDLLNRALGLERNFARAHAALADVWLQRESSNARLVAFSQRDSPVQIRIVEKIREALALDPNSAEAHASLGLALAQRWQMEASVQELRQAVALNPNYANAHHWLGRALAVDGRMDEAILELKRAAELDPFAPTILDNYAWFLCFAGRHREAEAFIERVEILQPNLAQAARRRVALLVQQGRNTAARAVARAITPNNQTGVISKIFALADVGLKTEAEALLPELTEESWLPNALAAIGRHEESIAAFTEDRLTRLSLNLFFYERACDPIRDDPRMRRLLAVVGATAAHARAQAWRQAHPREKPEAKK